MNTVVRKWGNSLAVRLPQHVVSALSVEDGSLVELSVSEGAVVLRPARPRYSLDQLLANHRPEHNHSETDWGRPAGKEEW